MPSQDTIGEFMESIAQADASAGWLYPSKRPEHLWGRNVGRRWGREENVHQDARRQLTEALETLRENGSVITVDHPVLRKLEWEFSGGGLQRLYGDRMTTRS